MEAENVRVLSELSVLHVSVLSIVRYFFLSIWGLNLIQIKIIISINWWQKPFRKTDQNHIVWHSLLIPATKGTMAWKFQHSAEGLFPRCRKVSLCSELFLLLSCFGLTPPCWGEAPLTNLQWLKVHTSVGKPKSRHSLNLQASSNETVVLPNVPQQEGGDIRPRHQQHPCIWKLCQWDMFLKQTVRQITLRCHVSCNWNLSFHFWHTWKF